MTTALIQQALVGRASLPRAPVPGPRPGLLGWRPHLLRFMRDPLATLLDLSQYGNIVGLTEGNGAMLFAFGPELNRELSVDTERMAPFLALISPRPDSAVARFQNHQLFNITGERHAHERRVVGPPLHKKRLGRWVSAITAIADRRIADMPRDTPFDMPAALQTFSLDVVLRIVFGLDTGSATTSERDRANTMRDFLTRVLESVGDPAATMVQLDLPGTAYRRVHNDFEKFETMALALAREPDRVEDSLLGDLDQPPQEAFAARLMALLTAGHETSYASLAWTLALLAQYPDVLERLGAELATLGPDAPFEAIWQAPYLDAVLKESLRILPPAAYGARIIREPLQLQGVPLKPGAVVVFSHLVTHHQADSFPAPETFDPERWLRDDKPSPWAWLPFGSGPRACPGMDFAKVEMKLFLARLLTRAWPELPPQGIVPRLRLTLRPERLTLRLNPVGRRPRPIDAGPAWHRLVAPAG